MLLLLGSVLMVAQCNLFFNVSSDFLNHRFAIGKTATGNHGY